MQQCLWKEEVSHREQLRAPVLNLAVATEPDADECTQSQCIAAVLSLHVCLTELPVVCGQQCLWLRALRAVRACYQCSKYR